MFYSNIQDAVDLGKKNTYLYTEDEQKAFKDFTENKDIDNSLNGNQFRDGDVSYRTRSYFITSLGTVNEADEEAMEEYWKGYLKNYTVAEKEKDGLEDWELALAIAIPVLAVLCAGMAAMLVIKKKQQKAAAQEKPERMRVDTTDDRDVDVYGENTEETDGKDEE